MPESPEEGVKLIEKWKACVGDIGDAMVNPGTPVAMSKTVSADGVAEMADRTPWRGFPSCGPTASRPRSSTPRDARTSKSAPSRSRR